MNWGEMPGNKNITDETYHSNVIIIPHGPDTLT